MESPYPCGFLLASPDNDLASFLPFLQVVRGREFFPLGDLREKKGLRFSSLSYNLVDPVTVCHPRILEPVASSQRLQLLDLLSPGRSLRQQARRPSDLFDLFLPHGDQLDCFQLGLARVFRLETLPKFSLAEVVANVFR